MITEVLAPHRDDFDVVFDNTAYQLEDLEPMVELFRGRIAPLRVHQLGRRLPAQLRAARARRTLRRHDPDDPDPRKAYGVGKVRCEDYLSRARRDAGSRPRACG